MLVGSMSAEKVSVSPGPKSVKVALRTSKPPSWEPVKLCPMVPTPGLLSTVKPLPSVSPPAPSGSNTRSGSTLGDRSNRTLEICCPPGDRCDPERSAGEGARVQPGGADGDPRGRRGRRAGWTSRKSQVAGNGGAALADGDDAHGRGHGLGEPRRGHGLEAPDGHGSVAVDRVAGLDRPRRDRRAGTGRRPRRSARSDRGP